MNLIDCDVHLRFRGLDEIAQFLEEPWRTRMYKGLKLAHWEGYVNPFTVYREDANPPDGGQPGSDPSFTATDHLDRYAIDYAILIGESVHLGVSTLANADWAIALATAYNDWVAAVWVPADQRYLGSIIVAPQDPAAAAREIDRMADNPRFVQVLMSAGARSPYGQRFYDPIYEAATRHNLPVAIHIGADGTGLNAGPTAAGHPSHYIEWHTTLTSIMQTHLVSLVCEGTFERFPTLRFVIIEAGVAWLPSLMWRLDKNWKSLHSEVPWVRRRPSEYLAEHVRLTTQPLEEPENPKHLLQTLEMFPADQMLLFASDYPHWDFDNPRRALGHLPETLRQRIFVDNAKELYRLPLAKTKEEIV